MKKKLLVKKIHGGKVKLQCCFVGCHHNNTTVPMKYVQQRVDIKKEPGEYDTMKKKKSFYRKKYSEKQC